MDTKYILKNIYNARHYKSEAKNALETQNFESMTIFRVIFP